MVNQSSKLPQYIRLSLYSAFGPCITDLALYSHVPTTKQDAARQHHMALARTLLPYQGSLQRYWLHCICLDMAELGHPRWYPLDRGCCKCTKEWRYAVVLGVCGWLPCLLLGIILCWALTKMIQEFQAAVVLQRRQREQRRLRRLRELLRQRIQMIVFNATLRALAVLDVTFR